MLSRILRTIAERELLAPGERVLVAISGGPDSTALLAALVRLAARLGISVEAAVVDHGLRPESAAEAAAVAERCAAHGVRCEVVGVDVRAARGRHVSWQDAARRARLAALAEVADRRGCTRVALGHTADDQAETVLFRIVRGTGLRGLAGIPYRRGAFVRPLLDVRRSEVLAFLGRRRLPFVEDPSNRDPRFARSRVRHAWLPFLAAENPRVVDALLALGDEARAARPAAPARAPGHPAAGPELALGRRAAEAVRRLAARGAGTRRISVEGGEVEVRYGRVSFVPPREPRALPETLAISAPGVFPWPACGDEVALEIRAVETEREPSTESATFAPECLSAGLVLRTLRAGERMRPRGGRGSRKLQDLLVDAKIPRPLRATLPVLATSAGTVLFVPGLRPAEEHRPVPGVRRWLEVRVAGLPYGASGSTKEFR